MRTRNLINTAVKALDAKFFKRKHPLNVMLSVTDRCNSHCAYCNIPSRGKPELDTPRILSLIDQISDAGCERLGIWGGEPLLRNDLEEIVDRARERKLFLTLDSNGRLVPEKMNIVEKLDHLIVALDGSEPVHDALRGKGSFQGAMQAIDSVRGKVPVWTITVLTVRNLKEIDFILSLAKRKNFFTTFQLPHHNEFLSRNHSQLLASKKEYQTAIRLLMRAKAKGAFVASSSAYFNHLLNWTDYSRPRSEAKNGVACLAGRLYANIDTDGMLYPCSLLIDKIPGIDCFGPGGFASAFQNLKDIPCGSCIASCYNEYNRLYSFSPGTVVEWLKAMNRTRRGLCEQRS